jgi:GGDEF domain-containing protein
MVSMEPPAPLDPAVKRILARAEQGVGQAGEQLLVERLHQILDDGGSTALMVLTERLLPLLQAVIIVLPGSLHDGASPALLAAARTLGAALQEQGIDFADLIRNGIVVHDRLLQAMTRDVRAGDQALMSAVLLVSRSLLEVEEAILLAFHEEAEAALAYAPFEDPRTGLAAWPYFQRKLADELQVIQRRGRSLALVLVAAQPPMTEEQADGGVARLLGREIRRMDIAARRNDGIFAVLLPETDCDSADAFVQRLRRAAAATEPTLHLICRTAVAPEDGLTGEELMRNAEKMPADSDGQ